MRTFVLTDCRARSISSRIATLKTEIEELMKGNNPRSFERKLKEKERALNILVEMTLK